MPEPEDEFVASSVQSGKVVADWIVDLIQGTRRPVSLHINSGGIELKGKGAISATWADIADVYILTMGRARYFVFQLTPEVAAAHGHGNARVPGRWHSAAMLGAPQPGINMIFLDRDEHEVMSAVEHFSGGRFPSPERLWNGPSGQDIQRRELFARRRKDDDGDSRDISVSDL